MTKPRTDDFEKDDFGMGPRIGYQFPFGENTKIDVGVECNNVFADPDNLRYFGVDIGIEFGLGGLYF